MNEINLKLESKIVETKIVKTDWKITYEEGEFYMSKSAFNWYVRRIKTYNMINRLKNNNDKQSR